MWRKKQEDNKLVHRSNFKLHLNHQPSWAKPVYHVIENHQPGNKPAESPVHGYFSNLAVGHYNFNVFCFGPCMSQTKPYDPMLGLI